MSKKRFGQSEISIPGFRSRPSVIGKLIGKDFSPAVFDDPEMRDANLAYYVGDKRTIIDVVPALGKVLQHLPNGKILFFHCIKDSLTKDDICNFFNEVCVDVPFKLKPNELHEIGTIPYSRGVNKTVDDENVVEHTYYGFELDKYESDVDTSVQKSAISNIKQSFENYRNKNEELQLNDVTLDVRKKQDLEKYFRRDKTVLNKLDDSTDYVVVFAYNNSMDEESIAELYNDLVEESNITSTDVMRLGTIRKKYPQTGNFDNYDVFVI